MKPEIKKSVVIPLKFTTTDGQELPFPDYAAVPRELLRKLEEIAIRARELTAAHKAAILGGTSHMVEKAMSDLTKELSALRGNLGFRGFLHWSKREWHTIRYA